MLKYVTNCAARTKYIRFVSSGALVPSSGKKHLQGIVKKNPSSLIVPQGKHLMPKQNINSNTYDDVILTVSHTNVRLGGNKYLFNLAFNAETQIVKPATFMCALDVSGSMDESSTSATTNDPESSKFSRLDLVKHSMNTLINCLRPIDSLGIVVFDDNASKVLSLNSMDDRGKERAIEIVSKIKAGGRTNLWDGLDLSLNELDMQTHNRNSNSFALLLTDGEPNVNPSRGIFESYNEKLRMINLYSGVHTFGYGYDLDSALLANLANRGGGLFAHIPDHTMCNTVFINFISNCLATAINKIDARFNKGSGYSNLKVLGNLCNSDNIVNLGPIQSGQEQNLLFVADVPDPNNIDLNLTIVKDTMEFGYNITKLEDSTTSKDISFVGDKSNSYSILKNLINASGNETILYQTLKTALIGIITNGIEKYNLKGASAELNRMCDFIEMILPEIKSQVEQNKINALVKNIRSADTQEGQILKAFSSDEWFKRWGVHYLKYFARSHQLQVCSNFKDSSLQHYGGTLFKELRKEVEDIFAQIPIPKPSRSSTPYQGNFQQSFYSPSGPCFDGRGKVLMEDNSIKLVQELKKGDKIKNSEGNIAAIVCAIKTTIKDGSTDMMIFDKMRVTPWHPIRLDGKWVFPANVKSPLKVHCDYIYNFVLDSHHIITIDGVDAITLGHGFTYDPVLEHPFFGTQKVIDNLKTNKGWENGLVEIYEYTPTYDANGKINSFF